MVEDLKSANGMVFWCVPTMTSFLDILGQSGGRLEPPWGHLKVILGCLGVILGLSRRLGAILGPSWAVLGPF